MNSDGRGLNEAEGENGIKSVEFEIKKGYGPGMHSIEGNLFHRKHDQDIATFEIIDQHKCGHTIVIPVIILGFRWKSKFPAVVESFSNCEISGIVYKGESDHDRSHSFPVWYGLNADMTKDIHFVADCNLKNRMGKITLTYMPASRAVSSISQI